jgi:hypothetical protein
MFFAVTVHPNKLKQLFIVLFCQVFLSIRDLFVNVDIRRLHQDILPNLYIF